MIDEEKFPARQDPIPGLEDSNSTGDVPNLDVQEQINNEDQIQRIEQDADADELITTNATMGVDAGPGDAIAGGRVGEAAAIQNAEIEANEDDRPATKNILGDNPPGSEDIAFNSGQDDLSSDQVKYNAENIIENFRENIDKTAAEINLDKNLKRDNSNES
jgi:hypothetical protein